jgi:hypothetical protein
MKKILFFILLITFLFSTTSLSLAVTSQTPEDTNTPTPTGTNQLDALKEKIASKVAQLKLTEKRGIIGTVAESTSTQITVIDSLNNQRFIDIDELTKFSSSSDKSFGISDVKKDDTLGILGIYNKQSRRILAREISLITVPQFISGVVSSVDKDNFSLNILTEAQKEIVVDIETITKSFSYSSETGLTKSGFSKITEGENIFLVGYVRKTDKNRVLASRMVLLPEIPKNPMITIVPQALEKGATIIPSTGSGKKLTPIIR